MRRSKSFALLPGLAVFAVAAWWLTSVAHETDVASLSVATNLEAPGQPLAQRAVVEIRRDGSAESASSEEAAPKYPFDPDAPLPLPELHLMWLENASALKRLLASDRRVNPASAEITTERAQQLLEAAAQEIADLRRSASEMSAAKSRAIAAQREKHTGPVFASYEEAMQFGRESNDGRRLGSLVGYSRDGAMVWLPLMADPATDLEVYLRYDDMLAASRTVGAKLRDLLERRAY